MVLRLSVFASEIAMLAWAAPALAAQSANGSN
jgi:hypothetical protein